MAVIGLKMNSGENIWMIWKDLQIHSTDRKCGMTTLPSQKHRSVNLVHLWSVQENYTPKMLPWLPPFCFIQEPQYTLVNLPHNQPYNLSKRLWAVIFIEFLIMLLRLQFTDYRRHELVAQLRELLWGLGGRLKFMNRWERTGGIGLPTEKQMNQFRDQS